ncbi:patatin family protein [Aliiglaciecola sp. CAU 1673]|uniref:patatin-like phospholipase family protein n=1 Tax=Aliiglaciecola sp. CAU 1673 TaxID=3032595 RepID=UPI0023DBCA09|nr:patatin family protein [Aliiglaciecola sp. CAU 1673]MDF2180102.1 patatin family protein [Aliiglaciecola sp. CAU 1673]
MSVVHQHNGFALVAEGGGQKGIFTAGVLDIFLKHQFWPFGLKVGVSAGAQNLAAYCARASRYAHSAIAELTTTQQFFQPAKFFMGGNLIDLDWYFHQVEHDDDFKFPTDPADLTPESNFYSVATDAESLKAHYLHTYGSNLFPHLKASSAIPFLYKPGVVLDGHRLIDGGVADPIPVRWAYEQGARDIVVIRTVPPDFDGQSPMLDRLKPILRRVKQSQRMLEMYLLYQERYAQALEFIRHPPEGVRVWEIAPTEDLKSMVLGSTSQMLSHDYLMGKREGARFLRQWRREQRKQA